MKQVALFLVFVLYSSMLYGTEVRERGDYRIMFYNVENLFDTQADSLTLDDNFTAEGVARWNFGRYKKKINRIAQVIMAVGGWEAPELVGLCEVENNYVLEGLTRYTTLSHFQYQTIHFDSPDERGIDVALLYQKKRFKPLHKEALHVHLDETGEEKTRDILYVKGVTTTEDTLHVFVNHWPSKYDGVLETIPKRNAAAKTLRAKTDSLLHEDALAKIIILGDFNTGPHSVPLSETLGAKTAWSDFDKTALYNLSAKWDKTLGYGTYKYKGIWLNIDQLIVSNGMVNGRGVLLTSAQSAHIYRAAFLLEDDREGGLKPFRTYIGLKYNDGFSDHLPIYLDLWRK